MQLDIGHAGDGVRGHVRYAADALEEVLLERDGDEFLDLGRGQALRLGLHVDRHRRRLGKDVPVHAG